MAGRRELAKCTNDRNLYQPVAAGARTKRTAENLRSHIWMPASSERRNPVYTQEIPFTDFPLDEVKLYFANNVIHLPSEY